MILGRPPTNGAAHLAKRFAEQVVGYLEHPEVALKAEDQIPLENIFRLLEMYRYDAYRDGYDNPHWHIEMVKAFDIALPQTFGDAVEKDAAIDELERGLREIVALPRDSGDPALALKTRKFFVAFNEAFRPLF